jgi:hypothetical protein
MSMRRPLRILSIEDDLNDAELIQSLLETEDIACEVTRVDTQAALVASLELSLSIEHRDQRKKSSDGFAN